MQPPYCMRCSSRYPSSNSWLPTAVASSPRAFMASMVGSSWKAADSSGEAPMRSPAATVAVLRCPWRAAFRWVARYSVPPASTVVGRAAGGVVVDSVYPVVIRPPEPAGGSRLPCRSLNDSSWIWVSRAWCRRSWRSARPSALLSTRPEEAAGLLASAEADDNVRAAAAAAVTANARGTRDVRRVDMGLPRGSGLWCGQGSRDDRQGDSPSRRPTGGIPTLCRMQPDVT